VAFGRVEARYTLTSAWTGTATTSLGGPTTFTVAAGTYYCTELLAAVQAALRAARTPATWLVTCANTEAGTGLVSIAQGTAGTWSIAWTSTDMRDALGFTGNLTSVSTTQTGTNSIKGMWLPDSPLVIPTDDDAGFTMSDLRQSIGPTGEVYSLVSNLRREWRDCHWSHVSKERFIGTAVQPMSWRAFVRETQLGTLGYFPAGARIAIYSNATTSTLLGYYHMIGVTGTEGPQAVEGWAGRWRVTIPRLINQSA
jgi:hypothetical protein